MKSKDIVRAMAYLDEGSGGGGGGSEYTAGDGIKIENDVISGTKVDVSKGSTNVIEVEGYNSSKLGFEFGEDVTLMASSPMLFGENRTLQEKLTAGENITIEDNTISAADEVLVAVYEQTSYADVKAAIDAHKAIVLDMPANNNQFCITFSTYTNGGNALMYAIFKMNNRLTLTTVTLTPQNQWTTSHTDLQEKLVSGTNVKTINNISLLGSGNIDIQGGGGSLANLVDGSATGSVRGLGTTEESDVYSLGEYACATGRNTKASGFASHAEGVGTTAEAYKQSGGDPDIGSGAHAEGYMTYAGGNYTHAEGYNTIAKGKFCHAEGINTTATGDAAHAGGRGTIAQRASQTAIGDYNIADTQGDSFRTRGEFAFMVGNGSDNENRSNAFTVDWDGNIVASGDVTDGSGNKLSQAGGVNMAVGQETWYGTYTDENNVTYQVYTKTVYIPALPSTAGITTYDHGVDNIKQILSIYGFTTDGFVLNAPRQNAQDNIAIYQASKSATNKTFSIEVGKDRSSKSAYVTMVYAKNN